MKELQCNETAEFLGEARRLREYIMIKEEQLASLREAAERIVPGANRYAGVSSGHRGGGKEDLLCKIMDMESDLVTEIRKMVEAMERVKKAVEAVEDKTMRMILEMRYLNFKTWEDISETMCYSERHIYRLHTQALQYVKVPKKKTKQKTKQEDVRGDVRATARP
ncbi:MAG: DUF1492 domain-containing protein [Anaerofustis sp.]